MRFEVFQREEVEKLTETNNQRDISVNLSAIKQQEERRSWHFPPVAFTMREKLC